MSNSKHTPSTLALSAALASGLALSASAFSMQPLAQGYLLAPGGGATGEKAAEGKCGAGKMAEGKCGAGKMAAEGKCGMDNVDADKDGKVSRAEFMAAHADKAAMFDTIDTSKDGFIDAAEHKAHKEGKGGEGKCGEGKCGEGKCGGSL
jgi:uncharacterized low-complexity protein